MSENSLNDNLNGQKLEVNKLEQREADSLSNSYPLGSKVVNPDGNNVNGQSKSKPFSQTDKAWMNTCLIGVVIAFWLSVYINGLPTGLGGGKLLVFLHAAVLAGFYKVNKD